MFLHLVFLHSAFYALFLPAFSRVFFIFRHGFAAQTSYGILSPFHGGKRLPRVCRSCRSCTRERTCSVCAGWTDEDWVTLVDAPKARSKSRSRKSVSAPSFTAVSDDPLGEDIAERASVVSMELDRHDDDNASHGGNSSMTSPVANLAREIFVTTSAPADVISGSTGDHGQSDRPSARDQNSGYTRGTSHARPDQAQGQADSTGLNSPSIHARPDQAKPRPTARDGNHRPSSKCSEYYLRK